MIINDLFKWATTSLRTRTLELEDKGLQFQESVVVRKRHFEAASMSARANKWHRKNGGPVADMRSDLQRLRGMSRDMYRNNPYAQRAIKILANNAVSTGIYPAFKGAFATQTKKKWRAFTETYECDFNELVNFRGIQRLVFEAAAVSGDGLIVRRWNADKEAGFELQVLESDFLDETRTQAEQDGGFSMQGVHFDADGRRIGYWLYPQHPRDVPVQYNGLTSRFVPKKDVIHVFEVLRPGQVRGIPLGASGFVRLKDFDEFQDAQLYKQKIAACFVMVVTDDKQLPASMREENAANYQNPEFEIEEMVPGMVNYLPYGKDVKFSQPPTTEGTSEFATTMLRAVASAYNVPYPLLANDFARVNFTSIRADYVEFAKYIDHLQDALLVVQLCHPVFRWFQDGQRIRGGLAKTLDVTWTTPRREMIDPLKESTADINMVMAGFISRQEVIRQRGYDPFDVYAEIMEDLAEQKKLGAQFTTDVSKPPPEEKAPTTAISGKKPAKKRLQAPKGK